MQLHQLQPKTKNKKGKRIGRGGKRGTYSGRGMKGQRARAGHKIRPAERDLIIRIPKLRGFKNKPREDKPILITLNQLEQKMNGTVVNLQTLKQAGLLRKGCTRAKILGDGGLKKAFTIENIALSESAKQKIETAGGTIKTNS